MMHRMAESNPFVAALDSMACDNATAATSSSSSSSAWPPSSSTTTTLPLTLPQLHLLRRQFLSELVLVYNTGKSASWTIRDQRIRLRRRSQTWYPCSLLLPLYHDTLMILHSSRLKRAASSSAFITAAELALNVLSRKHNKQKKNRRNHANAVADEEDEDDDESHAFTDEDWQRYRTILAAERNSTTPPLREITREWSNKLLCRIRTEIDSDMNDLDRLVRENDVEEERMDDDGGEERKKEEGDGDDVGYGPSVDSFLQILVWNQLETHESVNMNKQCVRKRSEGEKNYYEIKPDAEIANVAAVASSSSSSSASAAAAAASSIRPSPAAAAIAAAASSSSSSPSPSSYPPLTPSALNQLREKIIEKLRTLYQDGATSTSDHCWTMRGSLIRFHRDSHEWYPRSLLLPIFLNRSSVDSSISSMSSTSFLTVEEVALAVLTIRTMQIASSHSRHRYEPSEVGSESDWHRYLSAIMGETSSQRVMEKSRRQELLGYFIEQSARPTTHTIYEESVRKEKESIIIATRRLLEHERVTKQMPLVSERREVGERYYEIKTQDQTARLEGAQIGSAVNPSSVRSSPTIVAASSSSSSASSSSSSLPSATCVLTPLKLNQLRKKIMSELRTTYQTGVTSTTDRCWTMRGSSIRLRLGSKEWYPRSLLLPIFLDQSSASSSMSSSSSFLTVEEVAIAVLTSRTSCPGFRYVSSELGSSSDWNRYLDAIKLESSSWRLTGNSRRRELIAYFISSEDSSLSFARPLPSEEAVKERETITIATRRLSEHERRTDQMQLVIERREGGETHYEIKASTPQLDATSPSSSPAAAAASPSSSASPVSSSSSLPSTSPSYHPLNPSALYQLREKVISLLRTLFQSGATSTSDHCWTMRGSLIRFHRDSPEWYPRSLLLPILFDHSTSVLPFVSSLSSFMTVEEVAIALLTVRMRQHRKRYEPMEIGSSSDWNRYMTAIHDETSTQRMVEKSRRQDLLSYFLEQSTRSSTQEAAKKERDSIAIATRRLQAHERLENQMQLVIARRDGEGRTCYEIKTPSQFALEGIPIGSAPSPSSVRSSPTPAASYASSSSLSLSSSPFAAYFAAASSSSSSSAAAAAASSSSSSSTVRPLSLFDLSALRISILNELRTLYTSGRTLAWTMEGPYIRFHPSSRIWYPREMLMPVFHQQQSLPLLTFSGASFLQVHDLAICVLTSQSRRSIAPSEDDDQMMDDEEAAQWRIDPVTAEGWRRYKIQVSSTRRADPNYYVREIDRSRRKDLIAFFAHEPSNDNDDEDAEKAAAEREMIDAASKRLVIVESQRPQEQQLTVCRRTMAGGETRYEMKTWEEFAAMRRTESEAAAASAAAVAASFSSSFASSSCHQAITCYPDPELFIEPLDSKYLCSICLGAAFQPPNLNCSQYSSRGGGDGGGAISHLFCSTCIRRNSPRLCPNCRSEYTQTHLSTINLGVVDELSKRQVKCAHYEDGCDAVYVIGENGAGVRKHEAECQFIPTQCEKCNEMIRYGDSDIHEKKECKKRMTECKYCQQTMSADSLSAHQSNRQSHGNHVNCMNMCICPYRCRVANGELLQLDSRACARVDLSHHIDRCGRRLVQCQFCSPTHSIHVSKLRQHVKELDLNQNRILDVALSLARTVNDGTTASSPSPTAASLSMSAAAASSSSSSSATAAAAASSSSSSRKRHRSTSPRPESTAAAAATSSSLQTRPAAAASSSSSISSSSSSSSSASSFSHPRASPSSAILMSDDDDDGDVNEEDESDYYQNQHLSDTEREADHELRRDMEIDLDAEHAASARAAVRSTTYFLVPQWSLSQLAYFRSSIRPGSFVDFSTSDQHASTSMLELAYTLGKVQDEVEKDIFSVMDVKSRISYQRNREHLYPPHTMPHEAISSSAAASTASSAPLQSKRVRFD